MFRPQLPTLTLLYLFFILNYSILSFSAGNSPYDDNIPNYDYCHLNYVPSAPKPAKLAFGRVNTVVTVVTILLALLNIIVYKLRKLQEANFYEQFDVPKGQLCRRFLIDDILLATNHFDDALIIGKGGFGKVYKGVIDNGTITVAIKRSNPKSRQGGPEFWTEVEMLSKFRHSHIVSLIGYCNSCDEMILVYEYMTHGTLADHLGKIGRNVNNNSSLSWVQRLKICIGAARGLDYLHTGTGIQHRVIHRDVKSSNILLNENWGAKISDFGLSKTGPADQSCTHISTNVRGTFGYLDPEYFWTHRLTRKSDVYAFGVVLFEVLSGRRAVERGLEEEPQGLAGWAQQCVKEGRLYDIIDPSLKWQIFSDSLNSFAKIANQCLDRHSKERPTMSEVVTALEFSLALQQKRDSSVIEMEIFDTCGSHDNQENANSSTAQQEVIDAGNGVGEEQIDGINVENFYSPRGQQENSSNVGNEEKQIGEVMELGDANSRSPRVKPARIKSFTKMVRKFFHGTAKVASVDGGAEPIKQGEYITVSTPNNTISIECNKKESDTNSFGSWKDGGEFNDTADTNFYLPTLVEEPYFFSSEAIDDDPLPAVEGLQISGEPYPGQQIEVGGHSIHGTTSCFFEWVRHFEDGSVECIDGAKQPCYLVSADDVGTYLAIEVQPMDDRKRMGEFVMAFANENRKITCDPELHKRVLWNLDNGHATYPISVLISVGYLELWEPASLAINRDGYIIKCSVPSAPTVTENFSQSTIVTVICGDPTEFSIIGTGGSELLLRADESSQGITCSRDEIVLTMRSYARRAVERKKMEEERFIL